MARSGMANLIRRVRLMCNAGSADYSVNGVGYWTDDHLQAELDKNQNYFSQVDLYPIEKFVSGSYQWTDYLIPTVIGHDYEETVVIRDSAGNTIAPGVYTINYDAGRVTFTTDQQNQPRSIEIYSYNVNQAAANVWSQKAAFIASQFDFKTDGHDLKASQEWQQAIEMAKKYSRLAGPKTARFVRTDENTTGYDTLFGAPVQPSNFRPS